MKKSDLISGMIIELRNDGDSNLGLLIAFKNDIIIQFNDRCETLSNWNEDLTSVGCNLFDIVSVRLPRYRSSFVRDNIKKANPIWVCDDYFGCLDLFDIKN